MSGRLTRPFNLVKQKPADLAKGGLLDGLVHLEGWSYPSEALVPRGILMPAVPPSPSRCEHNECQNWRSDGVSAGKGCFGATKIMG